MRSEKDEIRSTLEIALEKAEKLGKASKEELWLMNLEEEAQRLAAKFLREELENWEEKMKSLLENKNSNERKAIIKGLVKVFLRNIVLPQTEYQLKDSKRALTGLKIVFKKVPEMDKLCKEVEKLITQYKSHREAIYRELAKRFSAEVEMLQQAISEQLGAEVQVDPESHPRFKEEWNKIRERLDEEYSRQLEYLKGIFEKVIS